MRNYGCIPDPLDTRDFSFSYETKSLPQKFFLSIQHLCMDVYDQGKLDSCTANALSLAYAYAIYRANRLLFFPSRLFIYYKERELSGNLGQDTGSTLRNGLQAMNTGICSEQDWPYDTNQVETKPNSECFDTEDNHRVVTYRRITKTLQDIKSCIAQNNVVVFGFQVYQKFETLSGPDSTVTIPVAGEPFMANHAAALIGYDEEKFLVRNSWGSNWGDEGNFWMLNEYLLDPNLTADFWMIDSVI